MTQLQMVQRCGVQYEFRYERKMVIPPGAAMIRGRGVHKGAEHNYRQKVDSRVDLPLADVVDVAAETVRAEFAGGVSLTAEEATVGARKVRDKTIDIATALMKVHHERVSPGVQPAMVERKITLHAEAETLDRDVVGILDLVTEQGNIPDLKTSSKRPSQEDVDCDQQLTMGALLYRALEKKEERGVGLITLVPPTEKHGAAVDVKMSTRNVDQIRVLVRTMQRAVKLIDAGIYMPTNPRNWWCSAKWCGYWNVCPFVAGDKRSSEEV